MAYAMRWGRPPLPQEHGAWAMLITPPAVALLAYGPDLMGLTALAGWLLAYCLRGPVEVLRGTGASGRAGIARAPREVARLWLLLFGLAAAVALVPVAVRRSGLVWLLAGAALLLGVVHWLADRGRARSVAAGLLAVTGLVLGGPLYYLAASGSVSAEGWAVAFGCWAFFAGSVFRVKAQVRERRSLRFRVFSVGLHLAFVALGAVMARGWGLHGLFVAALGLPALWALHGALRRDGAVSLAVIGKSEQWLTMLFGLALAIALRL